ncbi:MAG: MotA/TolQ/ExbB proton channel family protein [Candidatus Krumholzibacteria bacterium]|nr:MotA/TolQ/ExbB proton channel family protein [Candidatus Krumholzibacteria bacterium]
MFVEFNWVGALTDSPILMVLVACSVVTLGFALERVLYFRKRNGNADITLLQAMGAVRDDRVNEAIIHCETNGHPMGSVAAATIKNFLTAPKETEEVMQVALSQQKLLLERNTGMLGTMAAIAPLIGLLGTVWGIMRAFHAMGAAGAGAPSVVAAGVAEALVTTAAGLVIAVPAVMLYNHFNRRLNTMLTVAENHTRTLCVALREKDAAATAVAVAEVMQSAVDSNNNSNNAQRETAAAVAE